ncbi:hypothetical protein [Streptantibioticus ferralitis]|uniref:Uncharacterized protein n=1 Tax=Streptantibioticus ferralitis TaxID=236510 RepID=A0ABT5YTU0_9ACTN|nr:hypothetical protein [Streptantibioticus ferralitis]MDF2255021.1 hypothetical protein [Streptantibioticus ferralitis]
MGSKRQHNGQHDGQFDGQLANLEDIPVLIAGGEIGTGNRQEAHEAGPTRIEAKNLQAEVDLHVCMGLNACKGHGHGGTGLMAGMGECATVWHICHGANECRGQGGCGYSGSDAEQAKPGDQTCRWNGSCASPINESRVHAAGPYRGTSVWKRARQIFEHRMFESGIAFGPAPGEGYPDDLVPSYEKKRGTPHSSGS